MTELFNLFISHSGNVISVLVIIILGYDRIKNGQSGLRKEITAEYKERNDQLDQRIKTLQEESRNRDIEIAKFQATIIEKDKHIIYLTETLQGRNPDTINILGEIKELNKKILEFMTQEKIDTKTTLDYQTRLLETSTNRNKKIDEASLAHDGEPIRVPKESKK